jgi:peptidoglycan biosynthesis protein MviN/MurJ (putative lipid II flippase)
MASHDNRHTERPGLQLTMLMVVIKGNYCNDTQNKSIIEFLLSALVCGALWLITLDSLNRTNKKDNFFSFCCNGVQVLSVGGAQWPKVMCKTTFDKKWLSATFLKWNYRFVFLKYVHMWIYFECLAEWKTVSKAKKRDSPVIPQINKSCTSVIGLV